MPVSPLQYLQQQVCQKYGWSFTFSQVTDREGESTMVLTVVVGFRNSQTFSTPLSDTTDATVKLAKKQVCEVALEEGSSLQEYIQREETKDEQELRQVLDPLPIRDAHAAATWKAFWENPPPLVGVDVEGNQISPPVLVQIATTEYCILEVVLGQQLSSNLQRLLQDDTITKVFCDNFSHKDKTSLGLTVPSDLTKPSIIDLEQVMLHAFGPVSVPRGLSKIYSLVQHDKNIRIVKPQKQKGKFKNVGRFALIEQGKAKPLRGLHDLKPTEQQYAALDAQCTLLAYQQLQHIINNTNE